MHRFIICLLLFVLNISSGRADLKITVSAGKYDRTDCVVKADIPQLPPDEQYTVELVEISGKENIPTACQVITDDDGRQKLCFVMPGATPAGKTRTYTAKQVRDKNPASKKEMTVDDNNKSLTIKQGKRPILTYNYAITPPPPGVDKYFERGGYIHPAYTPSGFVLTNIQPKDHHHHFGIWNPWTRIEYDGKMYDLWNIGDKQGTVRPEKIDEIYGNGRIMAGYTASLNHIIFTPGGDKTIMNEKWKVKAWNVNHGFLWDFKSELTPSTSLPVLLKEYRYAGLGFRATEKWKKDNCEMMTSEGDTRQTIDGKSARWIYINGQAGSGYGGLLFLCAPDNYNAPQPLRIWDENANGGRGDAFINFAPTKNKDWLLDAGKTYSLSYRLLSYDGKMTPERAESLWNDFAFPPVATVADTRVNIKAAAFDSRIDVQINDKFFTSYHFKPDEKYPYFYPVNGPLSGGTVTSMRNGVYPHQSSLFFGCDNINGGNYWQDGLERGRIISLGARIVENNGTQVVIEDDCIWKRPDAEAPLADHRKITITSPREDLYQIDFDIDMKMLADVTILKTNHSLFSARIDEDLSVKQGGTMINAEGLEGEKATFGIASPWMDCYGKRSTGTEGIAIMQHPSNKWYPSPWFTRDYGFISPTPMYWPENDKETTLKKGEVISLRYRVLVHGGDTRQAGISRLFEIYKNQ